jgi:hypothetical protein
MAGNAADGWAFQGSGPVSVRFAHKARKRGSFFAEL